MFDAHMPAIPQPPLRRHQPVAAQFAAQPKWSLRRWQWMRVWVASMLVASLVVFSFACWAGIQRWNELDRTIDRVEYVTQVVRPGDTLWEIAVRYGPPQWDAWRTFEALRDINQLTEGAHTPLPAGETILVPVIFDS